MNRTIKGPPKTDNITRTQARNAVEITKNKQRSAMNKIRIPYEFQICGQTIKVKFTHDLLEKEDCVGVKRARQNLIELQDYSTAPFKDSRPHSHTEETFLHEIVHYILEYIAERELRKDEQFVTRFSQLLHQVFKTAKYK